MNKALDLRMDSHNATWTLKAREIQRQLQQGHSERGGDTDGLAVNACTVYEAGMAASPIRDPFADGHGCVRTCLRQVSCCGRCCRDCLLWLTYSQLPTCVLMQMRCLGWIIRLVLCCKRRSKPPDMPEGSRYSRFVSTIIRRSTKFDDVDADRANDCRDAGDMSIELSRVACLDAVFKTRISSGPIDDGRAPLSTSLVEDRSK